MAKSNRQLLITLGADTTTFSQKIKRAKDLTKELDSNYKMLSSSSKNFENTLDGLAKKQDYLNDRIQVAKTAQEEYNKRLVEQQDYLNKAKIATEKLSAETDSQVKELKEVQAMCEKNSQEWNDWQKEIDDVTQELKQNRNELKTFQDRVIQTNTAINNNQTEIQKMNAELAETKVKFDLLSRDKTFEEMQKEISETERKFENAKASTDNFGKSVQDLTMEKKHYIAQMEKVQNIMDEYNADIKKSKNEVKELETVTESLTREVNEMQKALDRMDSTDSGYKELENEVSSLMSELTACNRLLDIHKNRVKTLTDSYNMSENSLESMKGQLKQTDAQLASFGKANQFKVVERALESVRLEFELLDSKLELLRSKYVNFENSMLGAIRESMILREQTSVLKQEFKMQEIAITEYQNKLKKLGQDYDSLGVKIKQAKESLNHMTEGSDEYYRTSIRIGEMEREFEELDNEIKEVTTSLRNMQTTANNTLTSINNNIQTQHRTWEVLGSKIKGIGGAFQSAGGALQSLGGSMMPLTAGFTALSAGIIKTGTDFTAQITRLGALSGESGAELEKVLKELEKGARDLGATTQYSATQAAQGLEDFMLAGYNATDAIKGMPIAVQMATADNIELNEATELLTTSLNSLGNNSELTGNQIKDLSILANQFAVNAVGTSTDMAGLARSFVKVGGQVENMNMPLSTANTLLGILGDKGVVAEEAGNALSSILINLTQTTGQSAKAMQELGVSAFDPLTKKMKPVEQILGEIKKKLEGYTGDEQEVILKNMLGGKTQAKTLMKLLQGIDAETGGFTERYKKLKEELENAPNIDALGQMYKKSQDTLKYDVATLKSVAEESFLTIFEGIEPQLRDIVQSITDVIRELTDSNVIKDALSSIFEVIQKGIEIFQNLSPTMQENIIKFMTWGAILAPITTVLGGVVGGAGTLISSFGSLVTGTGSVITKFGLLKQNGVTLKGFFTNFKGTVGKVATTLGGQLVGASAGASGALSGGLAGAVSILSSVALPALVIAIGAIITSLGENENALTWLADKWGWFGEYIGGVLERISGFAQLYFGNIFKLCGTLGKVVLKVISGDWKEIDDVWNEGMAEMQVNTSRALSNISGESAGAIKYLRDVTSSEVQDIKNIFETTFETLPQLTTDNVKQVAKDFTKIFEDSSRGVVSISEKNLEILRGTSDSMAVLFAGITPEMDASKATEQFQKNMEVMIKTGMTTTEELEKDFKKAGDLIEKNLVDGTIRAKENANEVLKQFTQIATGDIDAGVNDIVSVLADLDTKGVETLRAMGTNWNAIFADINNSSNMSAEEMKQAILNNIERLGLDSPEKLQEFKNVLETELRNATLQAGEDGNELGTEILEGIETGIEENAEETSETVKETTKKITENATVGAKEGFEQLPQSVKDELAKAGVTINEQGNVIVEDMAQKGKQGAEAYINEMNANLPKLSGVAGTIQDQLNGINTVKFGGVTKQLSEINKWLETVKKSAVLAGASLAEVTTVSFGNTTKGLSEIDKWLDKNVIKNAKGAKDALKDITTVTFGNTTKGLSEVNKWLKDEVSPKAKTAKSDLQKLADVRFGGLTSSLSGVVTMLNNIANKADSTRNAINRVINSNKKSITQEPDFTEIQTPPQVALADFNTFTNTTADINRFKTTGGFYSPTPIGSESTQKSQSEDISGTKALLKATLEQNQLLLQLLNQSRPLEVAVNMDGRQVAKASAKYMESEINLINSRKNRLGGK